MRILHFSDPHFSRVCFHPRQFLSKQWLGNLNFTLFRRGRYRTEHLEKIPELAAKLSVDVVCLTGDMTSTSQPIEFEIARQFVQLFKQPIYVLPGNHDAYTKQVEHQQVFYHYFPSKQLQTTWVEKHQLGEGWWWVGLDCARANNLLKSNGVFRPQMDERLEEVLKSIPSQHQIIVGNHFPLYQRSRPAHDTERAVVLQNILKRYPNVKLYLHGHDHTPYLVDRQKDNLPLVLNAGSCAYLPGGTLYLLDLETTQCTLTRYKRQLNHEWEPTAPEYFRWNRKISNPG